MLDYKEGDVVVQKSQSTFDDFNVPENVQLRVKSLDKRFNSVHFDTPGYTRLTYSADRFSKVKQEAGIFYFASKEIAKDKGYTYLRRSAPEMYNPFPTFDAALEAAKSYAERQYGEIGLAVFEVKAEVTKRVSYNTEVTFNGQS